MISPARQARSQEGWAADAVPKPHASEASSAPIAAVRESPVTYVEVTEEGTEAAAVTVVGIEFTSIQEPPVTPVFRVNKPFVFVIREKSTGVILFIGKMGKIEKY